METEEFQTQLLQLLERIADALENTSTSSNGHRPQPAPEDPEVIRKREENEAWMQHSGFRIVEDEGGKRKKLVRM